jgi:RimJ/RimL family protein N-acetyltransferase
VIRSKATASLLGATGLSYESAEQASTGYVLARDAWGHGYASEALQAMIQLAGQLRLPRVHAVVHSEHRASARVLEKAGFHSEGAQSLYFPNLAAHCQGNRFALDLAAKSSNHAASERDSAFAHA